MMVNNQDIIVKEPFNWQECLWYLDRDYDDIMYRVYPDKVRRAFNFDDQNILVDISFRDMMLHLEWHSKKPGPDTVAFVKKFISDWFDLERDLNEFYKLLRLLPETGYMTEAFNGLRFVGVPDLFEALVWTIMGQQLNLRFAYRIKRRFVEMFGSFIEFEQDKYWIFPSPEVIAELTVNILRELQLSTRKAEYILQIAKAFVSGTLSKEILLAQPDLASRQKLLTDIKGIGVWTANYVLMKSLREDSAVPYGDAGLPKALIRHNLISNKNDQEGIARFYQRFSGWESYVSLYLWRSMAVKP